MGDQTTNTVKKLGWAEIKLSNNSHTYLNQLVSFTENIIQNNSLKFSKSSSLQNEIAEVSVRSILRYSYDARIFVKYLIKDLASYHPDIKDFYLTPPYIIFHKSNEEREAGTYHNDTIKYCGKLYTSWTPINDYKMDYPALSLIDKSHTSYIKVIYKVLNKIKLSNYLEKVLKFLLKKPVDLFVKQNHTYLWDSDLLHKGNLNKTNKSHTALVLRISHKPLYYEPTVKISEIINNSNLISNKQQVTFKDLSLVLFEICEIAKKKENFLDYFSDFRESTDKHFLKHISFSLSLLAQRFEGNFSSNLDLISFILSKENLVSLERFLIKFKDNSISEEIIRKFFNDENLSYQENLIVNKFKNKNLCDVQNQKIISWSD